MKSYRKTYRQMHASDPKIFSGRADPEVADRIATLVSMTGAASLLDWGSGKGYQYLADRVHDRWGGVLPVCYDVGVPQLDRYPTKAYDGVICTDVLEHIMPADVDGVLAAVHGFAIKFVYMGICCRPAGKLLPDGENAHQTIRPPEWWEERLAGCAREGLYVWADYEFFRDYDVQRERLERVRAEDGEDVPEELAGDGASDPLR